MFTVSQHWVGHNRELDTTERQTLTHTTVSQRSKNVDFISVEYLITWKNVYYEDEGRKGGHKNWLKDWRNCIHTCPRLPEEDKMVKKSWEIEVDHLLRYQTLFNLWHLGGY